MSRLNQMRNFPIGMKASTAFLFSNIVTTGIAYFTTPIYTRLLSPNEYGQATLYFTWKSIFGILAMFCLSYGVFNNGMLDYQQDRDSYSFSLLVLSNVITAIFSFFIFLIFPFLKIYINIDLNLILIMIIVFFTQPAYNFWVSRQRFEYKYKQTILVAILSSFLSPAIAIIFILLTRLNKVYARILGAELPLIILYLYFYFYAAYKAKFRVNTSYWKEAVKFNLPLIPHYLSTYFLSSSDRIMISFLVNNTATAYYSVAYSIGSVTSIIWSAINASLVPYTYENCQKNNYSAISKVTMPIITIFGIMSIALIMIAPELISIMASSSYQEAKYAIPPVVAGTFFQVQYFIYANLIYYFKKPKYVMYASVFAAALNIILNYIFIPHFGYIAAAYTTLACYLIQAIIDYVAMRKVVSQKVYNIKYIIALSGIILFVALISHLIYNILALRYSIILVIVILVAIFHKKIRNLFEIDSRGEKS